MLMSAAASATTQISIQLGAIEDPHWRAEQVSLLVDLIPDSDQFTLQIGALQLPQQAAELKRLKLQCLSGQIGDISSYCTQGKASFQLNGQPLSGIDFSFKWSGSENRLDLKAKGIQYSGLRNAIAGYWQNGRWQTKWTTQPANLVTVLKRNAELSPASPYISAGTGQINSVFSGVGNTLKKGRWRFKFKGLNLTDPTEAYVGEELSGSWQGDFSHTKSGSWVGTQRFESNKGAILTPSIYLEPETNPIKIESHYRVNQSVTQLVLNRIKFDQGSLLHAEAKATLDVNQMRLSQLSYETKPFSLADIFINNLQPILEGPHFESLEISGSAAVKGTYQNNKGSSAELVLENVNLEQGLTGLDRNKSNFAVYGLNGVLLWGDKDQVGKSHLNWDAAELLGGIPVGAAQLQFNLKSRMLTLAEATRIPLFDGDLVIEELKLSQGDVSAADPVHQNDQLHFKGYLNPVSMALFSQAMGWPTLSGKLSAMIPRVRYQDGVLSIEGATLIRLFGGAILLKELQLEDLFGALPALNAQVGLKEIDLETLTRTFSFGKITGTLEGEINGLRLENWKPVAFDAWFATPQNDKTKHRISQKAVDNISNLGGAGVAGALSRSFMRFFDEFSYARLGIKCKLERNLCLMSGIEEADRGYYLVKGGGLPRIDILGFNRRTDWQQLMDKLERITSGGDVVIE